MHRITATSNTSGHEEYQDAYKSELEGILHIIIILEDISSKFNIEDGSITIACDGIEAFKEIHVPKHTISFL